MNTATDSADFEKSIRIPYQQDGFDDVRAEYSQMLRQQLSKGNNGLTKTKFLTYGIEGDSMAQVKPRLEHIQNDLMNNFHRLGVLAKPLDGTERLRLMHGMLNMDGANKFHFNWKDLVPSGLSVKDAIAPTALAFKNSRTFQVGGIFGAVSFLNITASDLSDQLLKDFLDMDSSQIVTMHIQSVDQNKAIKTVKRTITELDRSKIEEQKKAIRAGYDIDIIPSDLATYGRDAKALLKELQSQNERMFLVTFLVLNTGTHGTGTGKQCFSGIQHRPEAQLQSVPVGFPAGAGADEQPAAGRLSDRDSARSDHQQHRHLHSVHHTGTLPVWQRKPVLRPERPVQQPYHGGPEEAEEPQWPDFGHSRLRQKFLRQSVRSANAFLVTDDDIIICDPEGEYCSAGGASAWAGHPHQPRQHPVYQPHGHQQQLLGGG